MLIAEPRTNTEGILINATEPAQVETKERALSGCITKEASSKGAVQLGEAGNGRQTPV